MQKKNIFKKKFYKLLLSITNRIESFFNFFRDNLFNKKKSNFKNIDNRIILALAVTFISVCSYFIIPSFYDKNKIKILIQNQMIDKYNLEVKFNQEINYGLLPRPHFYSDNVIIKHKSKEIAQSSNVRISILIKNFFFPDRLNINDLIFKKTDFKIDNSNFEFFIKLLNNDKKSQKINFIDSKLFYLNKNEDIVFLSELKTLSYSYQDDFLQKLNSKFHIFNIPINLDLDHNINDNKVITEINSFPLRLNIKGDSNYNNEKLDGHLDISIINKNKKIDYVLKDNSLKFKTSDDKVNGDINIKPFYLLSNFNLKNVKLKEALDNNSILVNLLKSEIFYNKNLNGKLSVAIEGLNDLKHVDKIKFDILLEEGLISISNLNFIFKNSVIFNFNDVNVIIDENKLKFVGGIILEFKDIQNFYNHFQIIRNYRKNINQISSNFVFNFDEEIFEFDELIISGIDKKISDQYLNKFNSDKKDIFNKVILRNVVKDFFKIISSG